MKDILRMDYINRLPQPFFVRMYGDATIWPMHTICVETGCIILDVCGKPQRSHISEIAEFIDYHGTKHTSDSFYCDYEELS